MVKGVPVMTRKDAGLSEAIKKGVKLVDIIESGREQDFLESWKRLNPDPEGISGGTVKRKRLRKKVAETLRKGE